MSSFDRPFAINDRGQILADGSDLTGAFTAALLTPLPPTGEPTRLANLSIRGGTHRGDETCILGFVVSGGEGSLLLRAVGPGLVPFGVTGAAANPRLDLFEHDTWRDGNDDWILAENAAEVAAAAERVHAFALGDGSADAALLARLPAGAYTFHTTAPAEGAGIALAEIYDAASDGPARLGNGSARVHIGTGDDIGILGFSLLGDAPAKVLIRAVGPTLASFNVSGVLPDPLLWLYAGDSPTVGNDNWGTAAGFPLLAQKTEEVSAFPLPDGSKDAALLLQLEPGSYTAQVSGVNGATGNVLIEIYLLR